MDDRQAELYGVGAGPRPPLNAEDGACSGNVPMIATVVAGVYGATGLWVLLATESLLGPGAVVLGAVPSVITWWLLYSRNHGGDARASDAWSQLGWGMFMTIPILVCELFVMAMIGTLLILAGIDVSGPASPGLAVMLALLQAFAMAALVEEWFKYYFAVRAAKRRDAISPYSLVLYGALPALGFASIENLLYIALPMVSEQGAVSEGLATAMARFLLTVPMHVSTGVYMGTKLARNQFGGEDHGTGAILGFPILVHGSYDAALMLAGQASLGTDALVPIEMLVVSSVVVLVAAVVTARAAVLHLKNEPWYTDASLEGYGRLDATLNDSRDDAQRV